MSSNYRNLHDLLQKSNSHIIPYPFLLYGVSAVLDLNSGQERHKCVCVHFAFHLFQKYSFCTNTLCYFQGWLYPKVKTEGCATVFHHKDCFCLGQEHSVNWQYTDTAITAMVIKNRELRQLKKRQREAIRRAEPIYVSAFTV